MLSDNHARTRTCIQTTAKNTNTTTGHRTTILAELTLQKKLRYTGKKTALHAHQYTRNYYNIRIKIIVTSNTVCKVEWRPIMQQH